MHSGITNSNAPRWHHFWNMRTTTHIPIVHARKRILSHRDCSTRCSQFPIFNCKPFQFNTCLYRQSLRFSSFLSSSTPCLPPHHALRPSYKVCIESHEAIPAMQQFRLLAGSNPKNSVQARTARFTSHGVRSLTPSGDTQTYAQFLSTNSPLFPAPALSINRLRADLGTHHVGLPLSPHHAL